MNLINDVAMQYAVLKDQYERFNYVYDFFKKARPRDAFMVTYLIGLFESDYGTDSFDNMYNEAENGPHDMYGRHKFKPGYGYT